MTDRSDSTASDRPVAPGLSFQTARHGGSWLVGLSLSALAVAAAETALPAFIGRAVDAGGTSHEALAWCGVLIAVLVACDVLDDVAAGVVNARSTAWLRHKVSDHILRVGNRLPPTMSPGDVATRVAGNAAEVGRVGPDVLRTAPSPRRARTGSDASCPGRGRAGRPGGLDHRRVLGVAP